MAVRIQKTVMIAVLAVAAVLVCSIEPSAATFSNVWTSAELEDGQSAAWADFDGDGDLDLLIGNNGAANRIYSKDNGLDTYTLLWSTSETDATYSAVWGDFDGDGDLDFAAGNSGVASRLYLKNDGVSTFAAATTIATSDTRALAAGDLDGDGDTDLFAGNFGSANVTYLNNGSGTFSSSWSSALSNNTEAVDIGDVDGDGDADLLAGNNPNANHVYINSGDATTFTSWQTSESDSTTGVEWGDYDSDGDLDFVVANNSQANRVYKNSGSNTFTVAWSSTETEQSVAVSWGDNDADGDLDILVGNTSEVNRIYAKGAGDSFTSSYTSGESDPTNDVAWGDYDGTGDLDYAVSNAAAIGVRVYANDDNPANSAPTAPTLTARSDTQTGTVTLSWAATTDDITATALIGYHVRVGTSTGGSQVLSGVFTGYPGNAGPGATSIDISMSTTGTYYWSVSAIDGSGLQSAWATEDSFVLDNSIPSTIATVYDGYATAQDFSYASSTTQLSANWTASTDAESGIGSYYYAIGSTAGATDIKGWTDNATSTSVTATGLTLTNNSTYYFTVKAVNSAGLESAAVTNSNGQKVDTTAPASTSPVNDGTTTDVDFASSTTQLSANWSTSSDAQSGIGSYLYAIGTTSGGTEVLGWTDNGTNTSVTKTGLTLTQGTPYYISVKARNGAGVDETPISTSDGQAPDTSAPANITTVNDGTGADVAYTDSGTQLSANWTASSDAISGIIAYYYAIGTTAGGTNVVGWTNNGTSTSVTKTGLSLSDGTTYYFTVKALNGAYISSSVTNSNGQGSDTTAPSDIATVNDGTGTDVSYTTSGTQLSANWTASTDAHSGIAIYWYSIGTTVGGTDTLTWTNNGTSTTVTKTGLTLTDGETYYINVKAENGSGLESNITTSNGQTVDASPPSDVATVNDGTGTDTDYTSSTTQLSANWTASSDAQTGVARYYYAIGTTAGATDVVTWTDNSTNTSVTKTGLTLTNGQIYYFSVKAENTAGGQSTPVNSDGQTVDTTAPADVASVNDGAGADLDYTAINSQLIANWAASSDAQSGIAKYYYAIGTTAGGTDIVSWTDNGTSTTVTHTGLGISDGQICYFSVKAENAAGLQSTPVNSDGQTVDTTAPDSVTVYDGSSSGVDTDYFADSTKLSANWTPSQDTHSGIMRYWYSIGTTAGASNTVSWTDNGTSTSVTKTGLSLTDGVTYYFSVMPENNSGITGAATNSDGQYVDSTPPTDVATVNDGGGTDVAYGTSSSELGANWSASSDGESGVADYLYSIGTSSGASNTVSWTSAGLVTAATATGLSLTDGVTYYISIMAENTSGLRSNPVSSDGRLVDSSAPAAVATLNDGSGTDIDYATTSTTSLDANWTATTDAHSGITNYYYSIGTSGDCTSVVGWTDNGTNTSVTKTGLTLTNGQMYIFCVRALNGASLFSDVTQSDGFTIDVTAPADITTVNDGSGTDIDYMASITELTANWTASSDAETSIAKYWYSIGTTAGATDIVSWTDNGTSTSVTHTGLSLTNGQLYYFNLKAENGAGLQSNVTSSDGQTLDTTPPTDVATVNDSLVADKAYATNNLQLSANWSQSSDPESGIARYWYAIGTATGTSAAATDVVNWTDNGLATSVTHTGLALTNGVVYYFNVKAESVAGVMSVNAGSSNGQKVDITAPDIVTPADGTGVDITYTTTNLQLQAVWTESADDQSGIARYWYSIGTSAGASDTVSWTDNGTSTSITHTFATGVTNGLTYYFSVEAENNAGVVSSPVSTNGQIVDIDPPLDVASVADGTYADKSYTPYNTKLSANWPATTDPETGVATYYYAIGTTAGATDVVDWTNNGTIIAITHTGLTLTDGQLYYFTVKADNPAGLVNNPVNSNGIMVDATPPTDTAQVLDGPGTDRPYQTVGDQLSANWSASTDPHSGVKSYWYSIGTSAGASDTVSWTDNGTNTSFTLTGLSLSDGVTYYTTVKVENWAEVFSTPVSSNGVTVDTTEPAAISTVNDGTSSDLDIVTSTTELSANWSAVTDPHTSMYYLYSVGSSAGASDTVTWTQTTSNSVTVSGLALTDGAPYYFNVKARNAAGLETAILSSDGATINGGPPDVSISSPAQGDTLTGTITISGTATDLSLQSWTVEYGPGTSPSAWKQIGIGTTDKNNEQFTTWNTSSLSGTYTIRLTGVDTLEGTSYASIVVTVENSSTVTGTITGSTWDMVSIPAVPDGTSLVDLFGSEAIYKIFRWDPTAAEDEIISRYRVPTTISPGMAFWIISYSGDLAYSYEASVSNTSQIYNISLSEGWSQIGSPFNHEFPWGQVIVSDGSASYDLDTAANNGLISKTIYVYDPDNSAWLSKDDTYSLPVQSGAFVRVYQNVTLLMDPGAGQPGGVAKILRSSYDYLMRISAEAVSSADPDNYIGASLAASDGFDKLDAPEPPAAPGGAFTRLSFAHDDWGSVSGSFTSDIRASNRRQGTSATWDFQVETNEQGTVVISWDNDNLSSDFNYELIPDGGAGIDMSETDSYEYSANPADGVSTAAFRIVVTTLTDVIEKKSYTLSPGWNLIAAPVDPIVTSAVEQLSDDMDSLQFYQFFDGKYYPAEEADIQAGAGYWIYSELESNITIEGISIPDFSKIEMPLKAGWNMIGNPFGTTLQWGDNISVVVDGSEMALGQAAAAGVLDQNVLRYEDGGYVPLAAGSGLESWKGYLLNAGKECTLVLKKN